MDINYVIMLVFMTGFFCILGFVIGFLLGTFKEITRKPRETKEEKREAKQRQQEYNLQKRQIATMMENINNYDGTSLGQKDIPVD